MISTKMSCVNWSNPSCLSIDMVELKPLILEVLEKSYLMSLATVDDGGVWVAPVICIHDDDLNIYWMSDPVSRHSKAIAMNPNVAVSIVSSGKGEDNLGIQAGGIAEKIDGLRHDLAEKHFAKRNKPAPDESQDVLEGDSWYVLHPKHIDLIYEKLFGFKKQRIDL